ncbi:unnamed protein product [Ilex paraguariensis]|uniref:Auxin efflux carrier family protein n=1 Tax=Ilex paraguariensis TaxID=185542 RepID=A0ABC8S050_9AQUA
MSTGNLGNLPLIIIPAICREEASPFGAPDICHAYGMSYASLSMAVGAIFLWSYVYNIVRVSSTKVPESIGPDDSTISMKSTEATSEPLLGNHTKLQHQNLSVDHANEFLLPSKGKLKVLDQIKQNLGKFSRKINLNALFAPSTIGALAGFVIGLVPLFRKLIIGGTAPLRVVQDSASLLGDAAIPTVTLIVGANLLKGLKGSGIQLSLIVGIIAVRYIFLPLLGIIIVKGAIHFGLVQADPLYQFVLLLQFALPPAMNIGTITQLFGAGETECSVILLWTYTLASVAMTLWSTFFMWLVA